MDRMENKGFLGAGNHKYSSKDDDGNGATADSKQQEEARIGNAAKYKHQRAIATK